MELLVLIDYELIRIKQSGSMKQLLAKLIKIIAEHAFINIHIYQYECLMVGE